MKKRIARIVVYFGLTCLTALVLSHPYIWQSLFGPKIDGVPFWAWQQETRNQFSAASRKPTTLQRAFATIGIGVHHQWIDGFNFAAHSHNPEMLPVLLSLVDDRDEDVRWWVALYLGRMPVQDETITALNRLADDPSKLVSDEAGESLHRTRKGKMN